MFADWFKSKALWNSLKEFLKDTIKLLLLPPQGVIFGFLQTDQELVFFVNYLLLLFKYYLYVIKLFHLELLKQILRKRIFCKKMFPNMMKGRTDFSLKRWGKVSICS